MARVLVVDDDATIVSFVEMALGDAGHEVRTAANGAIALAIAETQVPDLILLDMRMPVMDGWEFASRYGARSGPRAPIVVMTAADDAKSRAEQIHAHACLAKPFDLQALYGCVEELAPGGSCSTKLSAAATS